MEVYLKRIKKTSYDNLKRDVIGKFEESKVIELEDDLLEDNSENVIINGKLIKLNYSIDKYLEIVDSDEPTYVKLAKVGMLLHKETKDVEGVEIPKNILYEKEIWAYLSFKVFFEIVKKLRLDNDLKMTSKKIAQFYFNANTPSRTGLLFVWTMVDMLDSENDYSTTEVAFHFIDPVKATYERALSRNPIVLKAFVQAIINNNCDPRIKNEKNRLKVPNNVSCFARMNILDAYQYDELVETLTNQIKVLLQVI